jgi:hypothetical protein
VSDRIKRNSTGLALFACTAAAVVLSVTGIRFAILEHAPASLALAFWAIACVSVSLGGVIVYVFSKTGGGT